MLQTYLQVLGIIFGYFCWRLVDYLCSGTLDIVTIQVFRGDADGEGYR